MRYEIIYDYCGANCECEGIRETFDGTWGELQDYIKEIRATGGYNIDANCIDEEDDPYGEDWEEYVDPWEKAYIRSVAGGDYSSANPWDAPGMSVSDFI